MSSGMPIYDEWAVRAVRTSSPFLPVSTSLMETAKPGRGQLHSITNCGQAPHPTETHFPMD
jgi:hypothetical protein